ncbi:MAG: TRAP transporter small permease subunit [Rhizobiaceae bacterium]|nr:TRAP transporter small permease subunit [Rhizobiaceae bacterium]
MSLDRAGDISSQSRLVFVTRAFGWAILAHFAVWMVSNILTHSYGWPGAASVYGETATALSYLQWIVYAIAIGLAIVWVWRSPSVGLRKDAAAISDFNAVLVRWAFFAVLFIGLADMAISFLRVEGLLESIVGKDLTLDLGRSAFRGPWVHVPMILLALLVALRSKTLGFHWLALLIVIAELAIVITRFVFSYEQAFMGDLVRFWYAALFLFASAYTLLEEGHVRVDIFYAGLQNKTKGFLNAISTILLGITLCWTIIIVCLDGKGSIVYGPVVNFEVSQSGFGMYVKYLMASFLVIFAITMLIQFVSYMMESVADYRDEPGTRLNREVAAH